MLLIHDLVERRRSQVLIATHAPILMAYPGALLDQLDAGGIISRITPDLLADPERYINNLFAGE